MNHIDFKRLGLMTAAVVFLLGSILGCEGNNGISKNKYYNPALYGNSTYSNYAASRNSNGVNTTDPRGGQMQNYSNYGNYNTGGIDQRTGQPLQFNTIPQLFTPSGNRSSATSARSGKGTPASRTFPYVIDPQNERWENSCKDVSSNSDQDAICDKYEKEMHGDTALHPETFNGFKVGGLKNATLKDLESKLIDNISGSGLQGALKNLFDSDVDRLDTVGGIGKIGLVTGGWEHQATNWGTVVKAQYKSSTANLPPQEAIGYESHDVANSLLKNSDHITIGSFSGFADNSNVKDHYLVCTEAWFRRPMKAKATSFRIENADKFADDGVFILLDGGLKAYSFRKNANGFFNKLLEAVIGKGGANLLEFKVSDTSFHLMDFCFWNDKKDKGQGEVRYWRFVGDTDQGYEPLNPIDFRAVQPEGSQYDALAAEQLFRLDSSSGDARFTPKPANDASITPDAPPSPDKPEQPPAPTKPEEEKPCQPDEMDAQYIKLIEELGLKKGGVSSNHCENMDKSAKEAYFCSLDLSKKAVKDNCDADGKNCNDKYNKIEPLLLKFNNIVMAQFACHTVETTFPVWYDEWLGTQK